jgi:hypothetical protein
MILKICDMVSAFDKAALFIVFNRPDLTIKSFDSIRSAKPPRLYISSDGPRPGNEKDIILCKTVREIVANIDWECQVFTKFHSDNLGCKLAVSSAINWFFKHEEMGIIIEDDIVVSDDFFIFCNEMLDRYKNSDEIGLISGCNFLDIHDSNFSYFYSKYPNIWGWATWRRVWDKYDINMKDYENWIVEDKINNIVPGISFFKYYWKDQLDSVYFNKVDTWDFQLYFMMWLNSYLTIIPKQNLIINIGYNQNATHTNGSIPEFVKNLNLNKINKPITHNTSLIQDLKFDVSVSKIVYNIGLFTTLKWKLRRIPFLGDFLSIINKTIKNSREIEGIQI